MPSKKPFNHIRVTAELPFRLDIPSAAYCLETPTEGTGISFIFNSKPNWILGYANNAKTHKVLREVKVVARGSSSEEDDPAINSWAESQYFDRVVILPAKSILEILLALPDDQSGLEHFEKWTDHPDAKRSAIFAINQFLLRYQIAIGFNELSGSVAPVSEVELNFFTAQLFEGDTPKSSLFSFVNSSPGKEPATEISIPPDIAQRFKQGLRAKVVPIWLELAHEANSFRRRNRIEASVLTWFQALEVGIGQTEAVSNLSPRTKCTIEERLQRLVSDLLEEKIKPELIAQLTAVRQHRNKIVHEGKRFPFNSTVADETAEAAFQALYFIEHCLWAATERAAQSNGS